MELDSKSPELWQERQPWARGVKSPVGFRVVLKDDAGNCRQVIRAAWRQRAPVSSQSSRGSQNLLDPVGGRLHTVCCWLHQKRRVRPSESIWEFPPFIFPWTLTTFQKATSLNTVFWVCSPICLLLSYALLLGMTPVLLLLLALPRSSASRSCVAPAQSKVSVAAAQSVVQVQEEPWQLPSQSLVSTITAIAMAPRRVGLRSWSPSQPKLT